MCVMDSGLIRARRGHLNLDGPVSLTRVRAPTAELTPMAACEGNMPDRRECAYCKGIWVSIPEQEIWLQVLWQFAGLTEDLSCVHVCKHCVLTETSIWKCELSDALVDFPVAVLYPGHCDDGGGCCRTGLPPHLIDKVWAQMPAPCSFCGETPEALERQWSSAGKMWCGRCHHVVYSGSGDTRMEDYRPLGWKNISPQTYENRFCPPSWDATARPKASSYTPTSRARAARPGAVSLANT
jgi:hypothetical protein